MTYDDIRPVFEKVWNSIQGFVSMETELEASQERTQGR